MEDEEAHEGMFVDAKSLEFLSVLLYFQEPAAAAALRREKQAFRHPSATNVFNRQDNNQS